MADKSKYAEVRQKIIDAIRTDLIGPLETEEVLSENPRYVYIVGMLEPQRDENAADENEKLTSTTKRTRTSPPVKMTTTSRFPPQSFSCRHPSASASTWKATSTASAWM